MKKIILVLLFFIIGLGIIPAKKKNKIYELDLAKSELIWEGRKITGSHTGKIKFQKGKIQKKKDSFSGNLVIDMNSITCTDIDNPKYNKKLVDHLKSKDFFHTQKHKTATLKITKAVRNKKSYTIYGKITIRGKTHEIKFPATVNFSKSGNSFGSKGELKLNRTKFNVKYNSGKFFKNLGDKLIYDDFKIIFKANFKK